MASQPTTTTTTPPPEWARVDEYAVKHLHATSGPGAAPELPSNEILAATLENCRKNGLPDIAVSASQVRIDFLPFFLPPYFLLLTLRPTPQLSLSTLFYPSLLLPSPLLTPVPFYPILSYTPHSLPSIHPSTHLHIHRYLPPKARPNNATQGKFLQIQARLLRARSVLEVGTLGAFSTLWLATATPATRVVSLEVNEKHAEVARANLQRAGLLLSSPPSSPTVTSTATNGAEVLVGAALDSFPALETQVLVSGERERFDLVFIDADKENNWAYVDRAAKLCRAGALIVVDNVVRKGLLADLTAQDSRILGARKVVENVGRDERFEGTVLQTVGDKGYDGFLFVYVK